MTSSDAAQLTLRAGEAAMKAFQVQGIEGTQRMMHGTGWMLVDSSLVLRNRISIKLHDGRQVQVKALGGQLQCVSCR